MKLFYLVPPERMQSVRRAWHSIEAENGKWLVCIDWKEEQEELEWSSHPDVVPLPHPIFEATVPLSDHHVQHLQKRLGVKAGHNVHHVIRAAAKEDLFMRMHVL